MGLLAHAHFLVVKLDIKLVHSLDCTRVHESVNDFILRSLHVEFQYDVIIV